MAGAKAVLFYNVLPGLSMQEATGKGIIIPAGSLSKEDGKSLLMAIMGGGGLITLDKISQNDEVLAFPSGGQLSEFSSWGPGNDLNIKPDISAPGGSILSTYPMKLGGYATISGTSMGE